MIVLAKTKGVIGTFALVKAAIMTAAVALFAASEPFWHQLVLVILSAAVTAAGMVMAAILGGKRLEEEIHDQHAQTRQKLDDVQRKVGASNRAGDQPEGVT